VKGCVEIPHQLEIKSINLGVQYIKTTMMDIAETMCNGSDSKPVVNNEERVVILVKILKEDKLDGNMICQYRCG